MICNNQPVNSYCYLINYNNVDNVNYDNDFDNHDYDYDKSIDGDSGVVMMVMIGMI